MDVTEDGVEGLTVTSDNTSNPIFIPLPVI